LEPGGDPAAVPAVGEQATAPRCLTYLTWGRDALILLLAQGAHLEKDERYLAAADISRWALEKIEDYLHILKRDAVDPKMMSKMKAGGFA
jgi:hypothetical protein